MVSIKEAIATFHSKEKIIKVKHFNAFHYFYFWCINKDFWILIFFFMEKGFKIIISSLIQLHEVSFDPTI